MDPLEETTQSFINEHNKPNSTNAIIYSGNCNLKLNFKLESTNVFIGEKESDIFFNKLWNLNYLRNIKYWFNEKQYTEDIKESGIVLDFDFYQKTEAKIISTFDFNKIVEKVCKILQINLDIPPGYTTYAAVLCNPELSKKGELFKEGFHVLFPGIKIDKRLKQVLYSHINSKLTPLFNKKFAIQNALDPNSYKVPMQIYGTIRTGKQYSHVVTQMYRIKFDEEQFVCDVLPESDYMYKKATKRDPAVRKLNLCLELSIHYEGDLIKKTIFKQRESMKQNLILNSTHSYKNLNEKEIYEKEVAVLCSENFSAKETYNFVGILNKSRGAAGNYQGWREVLEIIFHINPKFKCIAILFSINCDEETWKRDGMKCLMEIYHKVVDKLQDKNEQTISLKYMGFLKKLAKTDNLESFNKVNNLTVQMQISNIISTSGSLITDKCMADLLFNLLSSKYVFVGSSKPGLNNAGFWYEYINDDRGSYPNNIKPFIYKWYKHNNIPTEIYSTISEKLSGYFNNLLSFYNSKINDQAQSSEKSATAPLQVIVKKIKSAIKCCQTNTGINSLVSFAQKLQFRKEGFLIELNRERNIIGVGNGILEFTGQGAVFHAGPTYKMLTRTTDTYYEPYDPENQYVQQVEKILQDIIPDPLKRKAILMHHSEAFVDGKSNRYFVIYYSAGASGKTSIMYLLENAMGMTNKSGYGIDFGYYTTINASTFTKTKQDVNGVDHNLLLLRDARFVHASEANKDKILAEIFKNLREGNPVRGLYESLAPLNFGGIIFYVTNNQSEFSSYNLALYRRILFINYPTEFVYNPTKENQRLINDDYKELTRSDRNIGKAFLSILVHHYDMLQQEYKSKVETILSESGLLKETMDYINSKDSLMQFINTHVHENQESKIEIIEFCKRYMEWLILVKKEKISNSCDIYLYEVRNKFDGKLKIENGVEYINNCELSS